MSDSLVRIDDFDAWRAAMQAAVFDGITCNDIAEIMRAQVAKAKKGEIRSADFVLKWALNGPRREIDPIERLPRHPSPEQIEAQTIQIRAAGRKKSDRTR